VKNEMPQRTDTDAAPPNAQVGELVILTDERPKVGETVLVKVEGVTVVGLYQGVIRPARRAEPKSSGLWLLIAIVITVILAGVWVLLQGS
jgi:hypothetical protein